MSSDSRENENGPIALNVWLGNMGITAVTGWRWEKKGWLSTINIAGRKYITSKAIREFNERAERGDFAKEVKSPNAKAA